MTWTVYWIQKSGVKRWEETGTTTLGAWRASHPFGERTLFRRDEVALSDDELIRDGDVVVAADPTVCDPKRARQYMALKQGDVRILTTGRHGSQHRREKEGEKRTALPENA